MDHTLMSFLNRNPIRNMTLLGFFSCYPVLEYRIEKDSAWVLGKSDHHWAHISSSSSKELSVLLAKTHSKTQYYYSVEDWMLPLILEYGKQEWILSTNRYILEPGMAVEPPGIKTDKVDTCYSNYILKNSNYKKFLSAEYIKERLSNDISAGLVIDNKLVAWGFTHDDGALGFVHVLEGHRNKGYATQILLNLIQQRRKEDKTVFGNIVPDNFSSMNLAAKLGFTFDRKLSWLKIA